MAGGCSLTTVVQPEAGKFDTVRKADVKGNLFLYADADNALQLSAEVDATQSRAAWQFVSEKGKLTMKSLHTTSYLPAVIDGQKLQTEGQCSLRTEALGE